MGAQENTKRHLAWQHNAANRNGRNSHRSPVRYGSPLDRERKRRERGDGNGRVVRSSRRDTPRRQDTRKNDDQKKAEWDAMMKNVQRKDTRRLLTRGESPWNGRRLIERFM